MAEKHELEPDGVLSDGVRHYPADESALGAYARDREALAPFKVPVLRHANDPHEYLFVAALDGTGNALESGARYLRTTDMDVIGDDVVDGIRSHPLVSAGLAVGCGWLLGRMFGSDEESHEDEQRASERREHEEHEDHDVSKGPSTMDRVKGRMADMLAGGVASFAARQVRNRIAGR